MKETDMTNITPLHAEDATFDDFWKAYPRKIGKGTARKAWVKAVKKESPKNIIVGLRSQLGHLQAQYRGPGEDFRPHPSTWLNGERWDDEYEEPMNMEQAVYAALDEKWKRDDAEQQDADKGNGDRAITSGRPALPR